MRFIGRRTLIAILIPFFALGAQWILWPFIQPFVWFFFFPSVFFSARIGGFGGGLLSAVLSAAMVWYFFIPPQLSWEVEHPENLWSVGLFLVMGYLFSDAHERLERANRKVAEALDETRTANRKITQLYEQTRELDELKSQFFANVSHELRTPLTLILNPIHTILESAKLPDDLRRHLEVVERNARFLYRHVSDLLDIAKLEAKKMTLQYARVDLAHLVRVTTSQFESLAQGRNIRFHIRTPDAVPAQADGEKFQRILLNLLSNAFKFTPEGGEVQLIMEMDGGQAVLRVQDNGPGISPALRSVIFERFRQVEGKATRRHGGTGLGLAIVKEFTELHGGAVAVDEAPGGALFVVRLPLQAPEGTDILEESCVLDREISLQAMDELRMKGERTEKPVAAPPGRDAPLVLVVEDNPDMNAYVVETLSRHYRVATAFDGREGLEKARKIQPDLILSDVMMPGMSGDQMAEELRRYPDTLDIPILMLTAKADEDLRVRMLRAGVKDYIAKPFSNEELLARIGGLASEQIQRRKNQAQLAATEKLKALLNSPMASMILTDLSGMILEINEVGALRLRETPQNLIGKNIYDYLPPDIGENRRQKATEVLKTKKPERFQELLSGRYVDKAIYPVFNGEGVIVQFAFFGHDITEIKEAEKKVREYAAELERSNRELQDFAYIASHDLQEPLRKIQSFGALLDEEYKDRLTEEGREYLAFMMGASKRMQTLINDLLQYSRVESQARPFTPTDLNKILKEAMENVEIRLKNSRGKVDAEELPIIDGDPSQMRQLFQNLIGNALKFHKKETPPLVKVYVEKPDGFVEEDYRNIVVEDNGIGFDMKYLDTIFTIFKRLHGRGEYEGTGVGLAICRRIAQRHGGAITAESVPGKGSRFIVTLPVKQKKEENRDVRPA